MNIHKAGARKKVKALIMGPPGQGKTHFLGSANKDPRTYPMLVLDFEGGEQTLAGTDVDVATITTWQDYNKVYAYLTHGEGKDKYKSVAIDSISETHIFALLNILKADEANRKNVDMIALQDYGVAMVQMRKLLRSFRDLDMHVFFTSHTKDDKDPREGIVKVPSLTGQLASEVPGMMDMVGYLALTENDEGETIRTLLLHGYAKFRVKVRTPHGVVAPTEIDEPTIGKLMDALNVPMPEVAEKVEAETEDHPNDGAVDEKDFVKAPVKGKKK